MKASAFLKLINTYKAKIWRTKVSCPSLLYRI